MYVHAVLKKWKILCRTAIQCPSDGDYQAAVYALNCEMCNTTIGLQLTRISVISMSLEPIYSKLVKPSHPIMDYNTRYNGVHLDMYFLC